MGDGLCVISERTKCFIRQGLRITRYGFCAHVAQSAEHILGKDEVTGSIPVMGSMSGSGPIIGQSLFSNE